jgi:hypothetical protein
MISTNVVGVDIGADVDDDKTTLLAPLHQAFGYQPVQRFAQRRLASGVRLLAAGCWLLAAGCWLLTERSLKASMTRLLPGTKEPSSRSVRRKSYRLVARVVAPWAVTRAAVRALVQRLGMRPCRPVDGKLFLGRNACEPVFRI